MRESDYDNFADMLDAVCSLHGKTLAPQAKAMFFRAMAEHDLATVRKAFDAHVKDPQRGQYLPKPADLTAQILGAAADDGRPGPEEAWAIAFTSLDERETVVWTAEIAAAFDVARPLLASRVTVDASGDEVKRRVSKGDEVGARMAFKDAYARLLAAARDRQEPVRWLTQLGWDAAGRQAKLLEAVRLQRLPHSAVAHLLPAPEVLALGYDVPAEHDIAEAGLARLNELIATIPTLEQKLERARVQRIERERRDLAALKARSASIVAAYGAHA